MGIPPGTFIPNGGASSGQGLPMAASGVDMYGNSGFGGSNDYSAYARGSAGVEALVHILTHNLAQSIAMFEAGVKQQQGFSSRTSHGVWKSMRSAGPNM